MAWRTLNHPIEERGATARYGFAGCTHSEERGRKAEGGAERKGKREPICRAVGRIIIRGAAGKKKRE